MPTGLLATDLGNTNGDVWVTSGTIENGIAPDVTLLGNDYYGQGTTAQPGEADKWATLKGVPCPVGSNCV
jgi:hypothetical protein